MIYIITGHYGSGKTEFAINFALTLKNPTIIDLDIVNPFFRTKDAEKKLESNGIKLISPQFANTNIDIPSLPSEIYGALQSDSDVIIDVGGDDDGAIALGQYNKYFLQKPYEMYLVINTKRPLTSNSVDIIEMIENIQQSSRLKINGLVNNTNIKEFTTLQDVLDGHKVVEQVSKLTGLPIKAVSATQDIIKQVELDYPKLALELNLILPWDV